MRLVDGWERDETNISMRFSGVSASPEKQKLVSGRMARLSRGAGGEID